MSSPVRWALSTTAQQAEEGTPCGIYKRFNRRTQSAQNGGYDRLTRTDHATSHPRRVGRETVEHFSPAYRAPAFARLWHSVTGPGGLRWVSA